MNSTSVVIRIKTEQGSVDWTVEHPNQLTFKDTLVGLFSGLKTSCYTRIY